MYITGSAASVPLCMAVGMHIYMYGYVCILIGRHLCVYVCMYIGMYVCTFIDIFFAVDGGRYIYGYIWICM